MKKTIFTMILVTLMAFSSATQASIDAKKAEDFIKKTTQEGLTEIINSNVSQAEKDKRFENLFNQALDLNFIGQFVLGRNWRSATPEQRKEFIEVYRQLNIKTWSKRFDEFKGKEFIFTGTSSSNSKNQIFINTEVPMEQAQPATVVWRVKQNGDNFKIVDIIIENVSLAITARNEYTAFIKNSPDGIDGLINNLRNKLKQE